jgi:hypothetical protein
MGTDFIAGLEDSGVESRIFSIERLDGLKLASSRPALHEVIERRKGIEAGWAIYATLRTGDVTVLPMVKALSVTSRGYGGSVSESNSNA